MPSARLARICVSAIMVSGSAAIPAARAALLPPGFLDCVVALGEILPQPPTAPGVAPGQAWVTEGTGFLYGYLSENDPDATKRKYEIYLVTAGHVVSGHIAQGAADILVRVNSKDPSKAEGFALPAHPQPGQSGWFFSTTRKDIAAIQVNYPYLLDQGYQVAFFPGDTATAKRDKLKELEVSAGDGVLD